MLRQAPGWQGILACSSCYPRGAHLQGTGSPSPVGSDLDLPQREHAFLGTQAAVPGFWADPPTRPAVPHAHAKGADDGAASDASTSLPFTYRCPATPRPLSQPSSADNLEPLMLSCADVALPGARSSQAACKDVPGSHPTPRLLAHDPLCNPGMALGPSVCMAGLARVGPELGSAWNMPLPSLHPQGPKGEVSTPLSSHVSLMSRTSSGNPR